MLDYILDIRLYSWVLSSRPQLSILARCRLTRAALVRTNSSVPLIFNVSVCSKNMAWIPCTSSRKAKWGRRCSTHDYTVIELLECNNYIDCVV